MEHHLEARIAEARGERAKVVREQARETVRGLCSQSLLERAAVLPWQDPGLERAARRVRHERRERRREGHDALFGGDLLAEHVAVETAPLVLIVLTRLPKLAPHLIEHDRDRAHARVRMVRWHARLLMAPRDVSLSNIPTPSRTSSHSIRKYASASGTTRTDQPGPFGGEPSLRYAAISGPVKCSAPGQ